MGFPEFLRSYRRTYTGSRDVRAVAKGIWTKMSKSKKAQYAKSTKSRRRSSSSRSKSSRRTKTVYLYKTHTPYVYMFQQPKPKPNFKYTPQRSKPKVRPLVYPKGPTPNISTYGCVGRSQGSCSYPCTWINDKCMTL